MSVDPSSLLKKAAEAERLLAHLQKQFAAVQRAVGSSPTTPAPKGRKQTYVVMVSTRSESPLPLDVFFAYGMAQAFKPDSIMLKLVDKAMYSIPAIRAPNGESITGSLGVTRLLLRAVGKESCDPVTATVIDAWNTRLSDADLYDNRRKLPLLLEELNEHLTFRSYIHGYSVSSADVFLWNNLRDSHWWKKHSEIFQRSKSGLLNVLRWFNAIENSIFAARAKQMAAPKKDSKLSEDSSAKKGKKGKGGAKKGGGGKKTGAGKAKIGQDSGSWDLGIDPSKWNGKVVTRFPPEPSGFLHIGHAKAVFLNYEIAKRFNGTFVVRLDDTNPTKEKEEFVENILRDLRTLGVMPDTFTHTSDYFAYYIEVMTRCLKEGHAYVDKSSKVEMERQRMNLEASPFRDASVEDSLRLWTEMIEGTPEGLQCCVRMKIDPTAPNGTLRDPTMYRCNVDTAHARSGRKYKVYPTYDFACPIVDSLEGVTHACRSKEYNERDEQYSIIWKLTCEGQKRPDGSPFMEPRIFQFSRLDFTRTMLSKRKLTKLVDRGVVNGWNDPRMPTIQGVFRRGLQLEALKAFVKDQALSRRNNLQEWDKFWTYNKKVLDPSVSRYFCIGADDKATLRLAGVKQGTCKRVQLHPKDAGKGYKTLELGPTVWLDAFEAQQLAEGFRKRKDKSKPFRFVLMSFGVVHVSDVNADGTVISGEYKAEDSDFKKIPKVTWVCANRDAVPVTLVELDYLFDASGEETKTDTWVETQALAESGVSLLSAGTVLQFMKRGFFVVDKPYLGRPEAPAKLLFVPDGKSKAMSALSAATHKVEIATR